MSAELIPPVLIVISMIAGFLVMFFATATVTGIIIIDLISRLVRKWHSMKCVIDVADELKTLRAFKARVEAEQEIREVK